jgi:tetratricopeptide (TPR) repeat protein
MKDAREELAIALPLHYIRSATTAFTDHPMDPVQQAHALAQAGDLEASARVCRAILARQPTHDYALFLLGSIEAQRGQLNEAAKYLSRAVKANPRSPDALTSYGRILLEQKRPDEAIDALSRALVLKPQNPNALILRGQSLAETEKREEALQDFDRALQLDPRSIIALHHRAHLLIQLKRYREAKASVGTLLRIAPGYMPALLNNIAILTEEKNFPGALSEIDKALPAAPENPELWYSRGYALQQMKLYDEALAGYKKAIALDPKLAAAYLNSANILMEQQRLEDALQWTGKAVAVNASDAPALVLRGNILLHLGRHAESLESYDAAIAAAPDYAEAHYHRGSALLLGGKFKEGFADFEYRWKVRDCGFDRPKLNAHEWRGEPLKGKSIVVYSEQGLGDTIQFVRFLPALVRIGAKLTFLCHGNLMRLFEPFAAEMEMIESSDADRRFDFQCALMSLPHWLGMDLATLPNPARYLSAEETLVARWRERIGRQGFKIGIAWQGNPRGEIDKGRSIPLASFAPLAGVPGLRLISLQKNHGLDQLTRLPSGMAVETLGDFDRGDDAFIDTAAIMQCLDLVVTSDTAAPHLAGALGVPTWVALKAVPDWRWMLDRTDSPWYPSLTLFRQSTPGDWQGVFSRMAGALRQLADRGTSGKGEP